MKRFAVIITLLPSIAFAWGETGHRVVCQIAFNELNASARAEVRRLLDLDPDFDNFADSCLFADTPERIRVMDHFINVPRSFRSITTDDCPLADTCLFPAIRNDAEILEDPTANDADKLLALKLLGHWVGDMHQPMHVSYQDDRGANNISVDVDDPDANLHGVWDYRIISSNMGDNYLQIAADLRSGITDAQRAAWRHDSPVEWANESYRVTISPSVGYCTRKQGACWYSGDNMMLSGDEPWRQMPISDEYLESHHAAVAKRLQQAGVRLAELLERAFMPTSGRPEGSH